MNMKQEIKNKDLKRRILAISYKHGLSHIGSCITAVDIIDEIFKMKKPDEKFVLSSGHAGLALYVVLEKYITQDQMGKTMERGLDAEKIWEHHGVHPDRCEQCHIDCSSGSLGNGLPIAVGMALADRSKNVYCLISDGECSEGSIIEALRVAYEQRLYNLKVYLNWNNWGAYKKIDNVILPRDGEGYLLFDVEIRYTNSDQFPFLTGQSAHYIIMSDEQYQTALGILEKSDEPKNERPKNNLGKKDQSS